MSALERFSEWEAGLDEADEPADRPFEGVQRCDAAPELEQLYDSSTLEAIDARTGEPSRSGAASAGWRSSAARGAVVVGLVQGVKDALEDDEPEPVVEIEQGLRDRSLQPVTVHLAWGDPRASVAIVRRWLL